MLIIKEYAIEWNIYKHRIANCNCWCASFVAFYFNMHTIFVSQLTLFLFHSKLNCWFAENSLCLWIDKLFTLNWITRWVNKNENTLGKMKLFHWPLAYRRMSWNRMNQVSIDDMIILYTFPFTSLESIDILTASNVRNAQRRRILFIDGS